MPRGIPKDPNHPRNKKRQDTDAPAAEPKRRGRPPGKKNAAKAAAAPKEVTAVKATPKKAATVQSTGGVATSNPSNAANLYVVHSNIKVLADAIAAAAPTASNSDREVLTSALRGQIQEMISLTGDILHPETEEVETRTVAPTQTAVAPVQPTVPAFQPPAVPQVPTLVQGNNLPTPPSFIAPPFPQS